MKRLFTILLLFAVPALFSGCGLFKKKCDCPSFGEKKRGTSGVVAQKPQIPVSQSESF